MKMYKFYNFNGFSHKRVLDFSGTTFIFRVLIAYLLYVKTFFSLQLMICDYHGYHKNLGIIRESTRVGKTSLIYQFILKKIGNIN